MIPSGGLSVSPSIMNLVKKKKKIGNKIIRHD